MDAQAASMGSLVQITTATWHRDSHDLFDFESLHVHTKNFSLEVASTPMYCIRENTEIKLTPTLQPQGQEKQDILLKLLRKDGRVIVDRPPVQTTPKKLWLVVKDMPSKVCPLAEGDVIKLGRYRLRVKQIVWQGDTSCVRLDDQGAECQLVDEVTEGEDERRCRFCLSDISFEEPGLAPCKCTGTMQYVHLSCLKHWVQSKRDTTGSKSAARHETQHCEVCTEPLPSVAIDKDGVRHGLVDFPEMRAPFIVFENTQGGKRGYHLASLAEGKPLKLGRGHESDLRILDVSISRLHATISCNENNEMLLEDNSSKFGTLVQLKKPRQLQLDGEQKDRQVSLQVGRTVLAINLAPRQVAVPDIREQNESEERELRLSLAMLLRPTQGGPAPPPA